MNIINLLFGVPLGYLMYLCYKLTNSYGWAIVLFTILSKIVLLPLSLVVQKNSIKMAKIQPELDEINRFFAGDKDRIAEEQIELYDREKYSPAVGCLPTLLQIPIILGLINVIYNPLQHILHINKDIITLLEKFAINNLNLNLDSTIQLKIVELVHSNIGIFQPLTNKNPSITAVLKQITSLDMNFFGINLSLTPSWGSWNNLIMIPVFSGISAFLLCIAQNEFNILQKKQGNISKWGMTIFLVLFSTYFSFIVPAGVGLYWIIGNLVAIALIFVCNAIYNPKKILDSSYFIEKTKLSKEEKYILKEEKRANKLKSKQDIKRFELEDNEPRELVFYAEGKGFYRYFSNLISYILEHSDIIIHYITGEASDPILEKESTFFKPYYIEEKSLIVTMMKLEAEIVVMTTPDLNQFHLKRSLVKKDIEYIYLDHGMTSLHLTLREGALDYYDTIFCCGPNHNEEVRALEKEYGLPEKCLVNVGYGLLDSMLEKYENENLENNDNKSKKIVIAPSWQRNNILDFCIDEILEQLLEGEFEIIIRPHPEYVKRFPEKMEQLIKAYQNIPSKKLFIETDFSSNMSIFSADLVITDWSSVAQEFSYATKKPSLFINTPIKITNPEYKRIPLIPLDISLRDEIGMAVDIEQLSLLNSIVNTMFSKKDYYEKYITELLNKNIYNIGHSAVVGGQYIIEQIAKRRKIES